MGSVRRSLCLGGLLLFMVSQRAWAEVGGDFTELYRDDIVDPACGSSPVNVYSGSGHTLFQAIYLFPQADAGPLAAINQSGPNPSQMISCSPGSRSAWAAMVAWCKGLADLSNPGDVTCIYNSGSSGGALTSESQCDSIVPLVDSQVACWRASNFIGVRIIHYGQSVNQPEGSYGIQFTRLPINSSQGMELLGIESGMSFSGDLPANGVLRINPLPMNGTVRVDLYSDSDTGTGPLPTGPIGTCSVDATQSDVAVQQSLMNCFNGVGLGLSATFLTDTGSAQLPGPGVQFVFPSAVKTIAVRDEQNTNHAILFEMVQVPSVPALSNWGAGVLVVLVTLGYWIVRRHQGSGEM
jgi:hypothetical protein